MDLSLKNIKANILPILIVLVIIVIFSILIIFQQITRKQKPSTELNPVGLNEQPVINGKFDSSAETSQRSKTSIAQLKPSLPHRNTITTTTGAKILLAIISPDQDPYAIYVETNIDFLPTNENLTKSVVDFRETAQYVFDFIKSKNVNPEDIFFSWGSKKYIQDTAKSWLNPSNEFPKVIKQDGAFVFEVPQK